MAATRSEYTVGIKTTADTKGADQTAASLNQVNKSAKAAGESINIGLKPDAFENAAKATKGLGDASEDSGEKVKKHGEALHEGGKHAELFGEKHHEAHAAVKAMGEIMPGVGQLAREMFNPATLAIGILSLGIDTLIEHFHHLSEEQQAFLEGAAKGVGNRLREQGSAAVDAAADMQKFSDAVASAASGEASLDKAMSNKIALFDNYIAGLKKVEKAEDEAEEARIKRAEREKLITPEQASAQLDALHGRAQARDDAHADQVAQFKVDQEKATLAKAQRDLPALKQEAEDAAEKSRAAARAHANVTARAGDGKGSEFEALYGKDGDAENPKPESPAGKLKAAEDELADAQAKNPITGTAGVGTKAVYEIEHLAGKAARPLAGVMGLPEGFGEIAPSVSDAQAKVDDLQREVTNLQNAKKEAEAEVARKAAEAQAAKDAADAANKRFEDANSTIKNLGGPEGAVSMDSAKLAQDRAAAAEVARIKGQSNAEGAAQTAAFTSREVLTDSQAAMLEAKEVQGRLSSGSIHSPEQLIGVLKQMTELVRRLSSDLNQLRQLHQQGPPGMAEQLALLQGEVSDLSSRMGANPW